MGKKSKSETKPIYSSQLVGAQRNLANTVSRNQPQLDRTAALVNSNLPALAKRAFSVDPLAEQNSNYLGGVLGGKFLNNNPYIDGMVGLAREGVADDVNSRFGMAGRTGGNDHIESLGRGMSEAELALRYGAYGDERQAQQQAAGLAPAAVGSKYAGIGELLGAAEAGAKIPYLGATALAQGTGGLLGQYTSTTQKQGLGSSLGALLGAGLSGWASGGFGGI